MQLLHCSVSIVSIILFIGHAGVELSQGTGMGIFQQIPLFLEQ